jgi:hypothetical protein
VEELETLPAEDRGDPAALLEPARDVHRAGAVGGRSPAGTATDSTFLLGAYAIRRHRSVAEATAFLLLGGSGNPRRAPPSTLIWPATRANSGSARRLFTGSALR